MPESKRQSGQHGLPLLITVDVCDGAYDPGERKARFKHVMETLPEIGAILNEVLNGGRSGPLPVTWFVRSDSQVDEATGSAAGLVRGWSDFWDEVRRAGGELGWHPHLYKREEQAWKPIRDPKRLASEADKIWRDVVASGWRPTSCRVGESVGCNELMAFLESAGILVDSTALPGRMRDDGLRRFDWQITPDFPYHPAKVEYRRPAQTLADGDRVTGEQPLKLLEIPFTTAAIRAPYDSFDPSTRPLKRYIDLSYDPDRLRRGIGNFKDFRYLALVIHPLQAAGREIPHGGLVFGGAEVLRTNLKMVLDGIERAGRVRKLLTMTAFRDLWVAREKLAGSQAMQSSGEKVQKRGKVGRTKGSTMRSSVEGAKSTSKAAPVKPSVKGASRPRKATPQKRRG